MKNRVKLAVTMILVFSVLGCATPSIKEDKEFEALIMALFKNDLEMRQKREELRNKGITQLELKKVADAYRASVELDQAYIPTVIRRMLDESETPYVIHNVSLHGTIAARFSDLPFMEALNRILGSIGLTAESQDGVVLIKSALPEISAAESESVYTEVAVRNLDTAAVLELLDGLYPKAMDGRLVSFGRLAASNTVYLRGPKSDVVNAVQLLLKADREIAHVSLEVLVVEFSTVELEEIGSRIKNLTDGEYSGSLGYIADSGLINFSKVPKEDDLSAFKITSVEAIVKMLISDQKARLISRPYISTLSGVEAQIKIVSDRYVIVDDASGSSSTEPVTSGVILKITPTVLPDRRLRMALYVEDSQFSAVNVANVTTEVNKNTAQNVMQVEDGQTIIIGGLKLNRRAWSNTGFPWLRHIPILNLVLAERSRAVDEKEVSIYITPRIWQPNMLTPLIEPDALTGEGEGVDASIQKLK